MDKRKRLTAEQIIRQYKETISHLGEQKSKEERNSHFIKIRDRAQEIVMLLNADCSYVSVADQLCDYLELDKCDHLRQQLLCTIAMLERIAQMELPQTTRLSEEAPREMLIRHLYSDVWVKDNNPKGEEFIKFVHHHFILAGVHLSRESVTKIVHDIPDELFQIYESLRGRSLDDPDPGCRPPEQ
jgi:hypothetical protein